MDRFCLHHDKIEQQIYGRDTTGSHSKATTTEINIFVESPKKSTWVWLLTKIAPVENSESHFLYNLINNN